MQTFPGNQTNLGPGRGLRLAMTTIPVPGLWPSLPPPWYELGRAGQLAVCPDSGARQAALATAVKGRLTRSLRSKAPSSTVRSVAPQATGEPS